MSKVRTFASLLALLALSITGGATVAGAETHTSKKFTGAKVNAGTVTHTTRNGKEMLTVSDDFVVPDTPDPHWQVIDAKGNVYLLQRLDIKDNKVNRSIVLPAYVRDVARVQIYCAWAEAVLGETTFDTTIRLTH